MLNQKTKIEVGISSRSFFFGLLFACLVFGFTFLLRLSFQPQGSLIAYSFAILPETLLHILGLDGQATAQKIEQISKSLAIAIGHVIQFCTVLIFTKAVHKFQFGLGYVNIESAIWIVAAVLLALFGPDLLNLTESFFGFHKQNFDFCNSSLMLLWPNDSSSVALFGMSVLDSWVTGPIYEEVFYRGLLGEIFIRKMGKFLALTIVSVLFALAHFKYWGDIDGIIYISIAGVLLFAARLRFEGILVPLAMHMAANISSEILTLFRCTPH